MKKLFVFTMLVAFLGIPLLASCSNMAESSITTVKSGNSEIEPAFAFSKAGKRNAPEPDTSVEGLEFSIPKSFTIVDKNKDAISVVGVQENQGIGFGIGIADEKVVVSPRIIEDLLYKNGAEKIEKFDVVGYTSLEDSYYSIKAKTNQAVEYAFYKKEGNKVITIGGRIDNKIYNKELETKFLGILNSVTYTE